VIKESGGYESVEYERVGRKKEPRIEKGPRGRRLESDKEREEFESRKSDILRCADT
jgi:hypothetical protein